MLSKHNTLDFSGQSIYAGIDVHNKMWKVCLYCEGLELKQMTIPPEPEKFANHLKKNYPGANYKCVYEAGYSGFWIQHELKRQSVECIVVNPADVPSTNKEKAFKTDRIDCRKLARSLRNLELEGIYVPQREELEDRNLLRLRTSSVKKCTRIKNEIKAMLCFYGIEVNGEGCKKSWTKKHIKYLETLSMGNNSGNISLKSLLDELKYYNTVLEKKSEDILKLSNEIKYKENIKNLMTIPGLSTLSSMIILTELIDIKRFKSLRQLSSFVGLIPSEYSSGQREFKYSMTRRGNPFLKRILVECSWIAIRKDPALLMCYKKYCKQMNGAKAIIKISRKLLNRIRYVLINKKSYEIGIVQ